MDDVNESLYMPHRPTERRDEWQGPMWNDCGCCNSVRRDVERGEGRRWCFWCERDAMERLRNLAASLRWAAALCAVWQSTFNNSLLWANGQAVLWRPGCGRSAP